MGCVFVHTGTHYWPFRRVAVAAMTNVSLGMLSGRSSFGLVFGHAANITLDGCVCVCVLMSCRNLGGIGFCRSTVGWSSFYCPTGRTRFWVCFDYSFDQCLAEMQVLQDCNVLIVCPDRQLCKLLLFHLQQECFCPTTATFFWAILGRKWERTQGFSSWLTKMKRLDVFMNVCVFV